MKRIINTNDIKVGQYYTEYTPYNNNIIHWFIKKIEYNKRDISVDITMTRHDNNQTLTIDIVKLQQLLADSDPMTTKLFEGNISIEHISNVILDEELFNI